MYEFYSDGGEISVITSYVAHMPLIKNDHEHVKFKPKKNNLNPLE